MKIKPHSIRDYSSFFTNYKLLVKKGRNKQNSLNNNFLAHSLFNKTTTSKNKSKVTQMPISSNLVYSMNKKRIGLHNNSNPKIDININVNYPKVKQHKTSSSL